MMTWNFIGFERTLKRISKPQLKFELVCTNCSTINRDLMKNV